MIVVKDEDPNLRPLLADFIIQFSTIETYLTHIAFRCTRLEKGTMKDVQMRKIALDSLSNKRDLIKKTVKERFPELIESWEKVNHKIGVFNLKRSYLVHAISVFNIYRDKFVPDFTKDGKPVSFDVDDLKELNEDLSNFIGGPGSITEFFGEFEPLYQKEVSL